MRKLLLTVLTLFVCAGALLAQRKVTGKVTDDKGAPLPNVSVIIKGSGAGTVTNENGIFSLNLNQQARALVFSLVGMQEQEVTITSANNYNVVMISTSAELENVVVVGYGAAKKAENVVGSFVKVSEDVIKERPSANMFDALQGRVPGLQVFTSSGEPSATSSVRIRGAGSLTSSSTPLYVLDGIPLNGSSIISINPEDYESITVLKDASATSIYGSRAANGVIYLTSKKGKVGQAKINLKTQYAVNKLASDEYFNSLFNRQELLDYSVELGLRRQGQVDTINLNFPGTDTKWYKVYYQDNTPVFQTNLDISGGSGKTTYFLSGSYFRSEGLAYRSGFERFTMRSNINSNLNDWLRIGINLSAGYDERETNQYGSNSTNRGLAILAQPWFSPVDANGRRKDFIDGWQRYHPEYLAEVLPSVGKNVQANPTGYIQITPMKGLAFKTQAGMDFYDYTQESSQLPSFIGSLRNGSASESFTREAYRTITNTGEYSFSLKNRHNFNILLGQEYIDSDSRSFGGSSTGQTDDRLLLLTAGPANRNITSSRTQFAYSSYFGRLNYSLDNKYYFDATVREDNSSRFGRESRSATFYSFGALWKMKQEDFMSNLTWLSDLNIKASYGTSGNSNGFGDYTPLATVGNTQYASNNGFVVSQPGNPLLTWENQATTNFTIDARFIDRINLTLEFYNRLTTDMLLSVPFPYTSGFPNVTSNVGKLRNRGIDVGLSIEAIKTKDAFLTPYLNFNYNQETVLELFQGRNYWIIPNTGVSWSVGSPVTFFYPVFAGIDPQTGLPTWFNRNADPEKIGEPQKDPADVTTTFNPTNLQQSTGIRRYAPLNGGFGFAGGFKNFYMNMDWSFSSGKYLINNDRYFFENPNLFGAQGFNQSRVVTDYWKQPGDVTRFPRRSVTEWTSFDSRLIEDASFMRLKAFTLGYNIPSSVLRNTGFLKSVGVYFTGRNLVTFTKYTGPDPEVDSNLSLGANPNTRQYAFGLNLGF